MIWVLLVSVIILCLIVHMMRKEIESIKRVQLHMYKIVCVEDFEKAKAIYYEKYGSDAE